MSFTNNPYTHVPSIFDVKNEDRELRVFGVVADATPIILPRVVVEPYYNQLILYVRFEKGAALNHMDLRVKYRQPFDDVDYERPVIDSQAVARVSMIEPNRFIATGNYEMAIPIRSASFIVECTFDGDVTGTSLGLRSTLGMA